MHSDTNQSQVKKIKSKPVPPAIIATCLNLRTFGSDFLSGRMANWPVSEKEKEEEEEEEGKFSLHLSFAAPQWHLVTTAAPSLLFPLYTSSPLGPLKSILSPMAMLSRCWDNFPPSGKEGWEFLKYTWWHHSRVGAIMLVKCSLTALS